MEAMQGRPGGSGQAGRGLSRSRSALPAAALSPRRRTCNVWVHLGVSPSFSRRGHPSGNQEQWRGTPQGLCFCHRACLCVWFGVSGCVLVGCLGVLPDVCLSASVSFPCGGQVLCDRGPREGEGFLLPGPPRAGVPCVERLVCAAV